MTDGDDETPEEDTNVEDTDVEDTDVEAESGADSEAEVEDDTDAEGEDDTEPEVEADSETETEDDSEPEAEEATDTDSETDTDPEPETDTESEAEPDIGAEAEEPDTDSEPAETDVDAESIESRLDEAAAALEEADTEADLDSVAKMLDDIESLLEAADLPEPEDEEEEGPRDQLEGRLAELREQLESERGPYPEDVVEAVESAAETLRETRWTEQGAVEIVAAVTQFLEVASEAIDAHFEMIDEEADAEMLANELDATATAIMDVGLDPDEDAETLTALVEAADELAAGIEEAGEWNDLETNEQLLAEGFYDVLGHYKDFPIEWSAVKEHEQRGNAEMVLLALESLESDFMEERCLETLQRMGAQEAFEPMHQRAQKRGKPAIRVLGKIGDDAAVETLLEYVDADSDPQLQKVTFRALGEIGSEEATQALANQLQMDNERVRPHAARALGLIGDTRAIEPLADTLESDESDNVRAAAAWALRQIGTEDALEAAAEYADDRSYLVQHEAETAATALESATAEA